MNHDGPIHWHEGLFLQPHHMQVMQRFLQYRIDQSFALTWPHPYGLLDSELSTEALSNMWVRFNRLHAVMPGGIEVRYPEFAKLNQLNIKDAFDRFPEGFTILLGVPPFQPSAPNVVDASIGDLADTSTQDNSTINCLYQQESISFNDENSGQKPQDLPIRRVNARLLLTGGIASELDTIPLLRVIRTTGEDASMPQHDPMFVPPCMMLRGSPVLKDLVRDLGDQLSADRSAVIDRLNRGGFNVDAIAGRQVEQLMKLQVLNRFSGLLSQIAKVGQASPFHAYLYMLECLGELTALSPDRDLFNNYPTYNHDDPMPAFAELDRRIREIAMSDKKTGYREIEFVREGRLLLAVLEEADCTEPNQYLLGIRTRMDPKGLAQLVEDPSEFKLMSKRRISGLVRGIILKEERYPPIGLPTANDLHYYRLHIHESQTMWDSIRKEKAMAIRWPDLESSDFKIKLYMTIPG